MGAAFSALIRARMAAEGIDGRLEDGSRYLEADADEKREHGVEVWIVAPDGFVFGADYSQIREA